MHRPPLMYVITLLASKPCSYLDPSTLSMKHPKTLPMISEILRQRLSWTTPCPRKEPFTLAMIDALRQWLFQHSTSTHSLSTTFLLSEYAVYDWVRLGFFTGSHLSEYGQTSATASLFPCAPLGASLPPATGVLWQASRWHLSPQISPFTIITLALVIKNSAISTRLWITSGNCTYASVSIKARTILRSENSLSNLKLLSTQFEWLLIFFDELSSFKSHLWNLTDNSVKLPAPIAPCFVIHMSGTRCASLVIECIPTQMTTADSTFRASCCTPIVSQQPFVLS
jgi:hypothetical protein